MTDHLEKPFKDWMLIYLCEIPDVCVWVQNTGTIVFRDPKYGVRAFRSGTPNGACDISGIYQKDGARIEIETKTQKKKLSKDQLGWRDFIRASNGLYLYAKRRNQNDPQADARYWTDEFIKLLKARS